MKRSLMLLLSCASTLLLAQTLAVKQGSWETTNKSTMFPRPMVDKDCITKADLEQLTNGPDKEEDQSCKLVKAPTVSGNRWVADRKCPDGRTVHAEFVAESQEKVTGTIVSNPPKGGPPMRIDVSARWLGASCAGVK
jgi:Protein of unknown function (DUF3617)